MAVYGISFTQINLHHSKGASAVLARSMAVVRTGVALIQEPWVHKGRIVGLGGGSLCFRGSMENGPRTCILIKGMDAMLRPELSTRDLTVVEVDYPGRNGLRRKVLLVSAYFPYESDSPPMEVRRLVRASGSQRIPLIMGCDANAHHLICRSSDCNPRGRMLLEFLAATDLEILNTGNEPTFQTSVRKEVIDLTLCSSKLVRDVVGWRVSNEPSLSDHRHIVYRQASCLL